MALCPVNDHVVVGPVVLQVLCWKFQFPEEDDLWVRDDKWPGVVVVTGPVSMFEKPGGQVMVTIKVEPGARVVLTPLSFPWTVGKPTSDQRAVAKRHQADGALHARDSARRAVESFGWIRDENGERALSVRLNDRCSEAHGAQWKRLHCGHVWCNLCDGFVCPVSLNAVKGPGPVIKCNRLPRGFEEYVHLFCDASSDRDHSLLSATMVAAFGRQKVAANFHRSTLADKHVFERREKTC